MCEINILFIADFSLPHPATWNSSTGMKLKEELCASNRKNANAINVPLQKHSFHTIVEIIPHKTEEKQCSFFFRGVILDCIQIITNQLKKGMFLILKIF